MPMDLQMEYKILSSMEKVFCENTLTREKDFEDFNCSVVEGAKGEKIAFQIALKSNENIFVSFEAQGALSDSVTFRQVGVVPCELPAPGMIKDMLRADPGLYPDPLIPVKESVRLLPGVWYSIWVSVDLKEDRKAGIYPLTVRCYKRHYQDAPWDKEVPYEISVPVKIHLHNTKLEKQKLICTNWFYADCLAEYYKVKVFSEPFWDLLEKYMLDYAAHGRNMILTPLWSVPLDTRIGGERPTAQLLDIAYENGKYSFDFTRLKRWIDLGRKCGIEYFEMSHFFTQWGAKFTPKILVKVGKRLTKRFHWNVKADSPRYREFLTQLMENLIPFLRDEGLSGKCYFHFSDEPFEGDIENYKRSTAPLREVLTDEEEFPVIDALSSPKFFQEGLVRTPVPYFCHLEAFEKEPIKHKWCYFAGNAEHYPMRCLGAPLCNYRILGVLLYYYKMEGFLHWGHNFWFSQYSRETDLNPWVETTAGRGFTGGNIYNVYPGKDGSPVAAQHYESFMEGMYDLRLLETLEMKSSRKKVLALIDSTSGTPLAMNNLPADHTWILKLRRKIFAVLDPE